MPIIKAEITNWILKNLCYPKANAFLTSLANPIKSQNKLLKTITTNLANSLYGKSLNVRSALSYQDFSRMVPIVKYADMMPWIEKQKQGVQHILTPHRVLLFEKTSGSSSTAKYIPYTKPLLRSFNNMFQIWAYDILKNGPVLKTKRIFMSISPPIKEAHTKAKIPIGFANDSGYLKKIWRAIINPYLIYPPQLKVEQTAIEFRSALAAALLAEEQLEVISIWNPSYLLILLDLIASDINYFATFISKKRRDLLQSKPIAWDALWSELKIISCWNSATAALQANKLQALFPNTFLQGKGLLATEAPMTIPLINAPSYVPLIDDVFFEFLDKHGEIKLLHELNQGEIYQIIISQQGGLYRYQMQDNVKVQASHFNTPCLEFVGRINNDCDLVGEKFSEELVTGALQNVFVTIPFCALLPSLHENGTGQYILFTDEMIAGVAKQIENEFCKNYHYHNARIIGQLQEAKIIFIPQLREQIHQFHVMRGMRLGNIKDKILWTDLKLASELIKYLGYI